MNEIEKPNVNPTNLISNRVVVEDNNNRDE